MTLPSLAAWFIDADEDDASGSSYRREDRSAHHTTSHTSDRASTLRESWSANDLADLEIVRQIATGDERALRALYDRVYPSLWDFARSLVHTRDAADDLVQEAMTLLWQRAPQWDPRAHVRGFLFTAVKLHARNVARHHRVALRTEETRVDDVVQTTMASIPATPSERVEHRELVKAVAQAIAELPETRRMALLLRWRDQLPYEEIARVLGVSATAAQHLVVRARAAVRARIAPLLG